MCDSPPEEFQNPCNFIFRALTSAFEVHSAQAALSKRKGKISSCTRLPLPYSLLFSLSYSLSILYRTPLSIPYRIPSTIRSVQDLGFDDSESEQTEPVPLQNVTSATFKKILVWLEQHKGDEVPDKVSSTRATRCPTLATIVGLL